MSIITKTQLDLSTTAAFVSFGITFIIYFISSFLAAIFSVIIFNQDEPVLFQFLLIAIIHIPAVYIFFKIKRFKSGFTFLQNNNRSIAITIFLSGIIFMLYSLGYSLNRTWVTISIIVSVIICLLGVLIWIHKSITAKYIEDIKARAIDQLEEELAAKDEVIAKLSDENASMGKIIHDFTHRVEKLEALKRNLATGRLALAGNSDMEAGSDETADIIDVYDKVINDYNAEISQKLPKKSTLTKTNIMSIDLLLEHFQTLADDNNIEFTVKTSEGLRFAIEAVIEEGKLETLIGDLLYNAIRAVNASSGSRRAIFVIIGPASGCCLEICVLDSGIPFDIDVLLKLGKERVTTHADNGGSGIGFMTTFETLNKCKGSLIITEKPPDSSGFTKSITVLFDCKDQYIIRSYRADEITSSLASYGDSSEIIIENRS